MGTPMDKKALLHRIIELETAAREVAEDLEGVEGRALRVAADSLHAAEGLADAGTLDAIRLGTHQEAARANARHLRAVLREKGRTG
jgi:hypothetical protein